ncbi:DegT/DnrJ/EryC1/StrS family aminotransferase [Haloarchaeobius sp. HRN-SO-5]|uniref:DegT/DnrJ/EryC1/StrS family aminotransferase n=1 Tax=Haloarchaeobius sp. HRN-SO-5 TaxID=3446118 RepID=UPI003EBF664D
MTGPFPADRQVAYTVSACAAFERIVQLESLAGSRVLLPAYICQEGFRPIFERYDVEPVFVDVDRETRHVDVDAAMERLGDVDAVLVVHAFGLPMALDALVDHARREDVLVVEDCARALGARIDDQLVGSFGDYAIFSFSKVSPLFTGGCLVYGPGAEPVELDAPTINVDLLVKTLYYWSTYEVPYEDRLVSLYDRVIGDRGYSIAGAEQDDTEETGTSVRRLDPVNRRLFDRYVGRGFQERLAEHRALADDLRETLRAHDVAVQPDGPGRVHHVVSATVPDRRDDLVEYLKSRGHTVRVIWKYPWGVCRDDQRAERRYPEAAYLQAHHVTFPIVGLSRADVRQLRADVRAFFADVDEPGPRLVT